MKRAQQHAPFLAFGVAWLSPGPTCQASNNSDEVKASARSSANKFQNRRREVAGFSVLR